MTLKPKDFIDILVYVSKVDFKMVTFITQG